MDGMLQNATYGMQMLDVALRTKSQLAPGPPTSQHYPQHQHQHPSQSHHQPPLNSTSSLTAPSSQVQPPPSTPVTTGPSSGPSYGYNTNSHPHPNQNSSSSSSSPRIMKDGSGGVKSGVDDGGRKVKSESGADKGVPANGNLSSGATTTSATTAVAAGATGVGAGSTAPTSGDRSKRQVDLSLFPHLLAFI
jgi:hypothetical protein